MEFNSVDCLLLAWHLGYTAAVSAKATVIDTKQMVVEVKSKTPLTKRVDNAVWMIKERSENGAIKSLDALRQKIAYVSWPGLGANVTVLLYLVFILCGLEASTLGTLTKITPIDQIREFLITYVFKSSGNAIFVMEIMVLAHCVEAMYVWALLHKFKLSAGALASWLILTAFIGYPVTQRAQLLNRTFTEKAVSKQE